MDNNIIRIQFEEQIGKGLWEILEGDIITQIKRESKVESTGNYFKYILEGHSFKVNQELAPGLHKIFREVCDKLDFEEPVELYISNSPELNAFASARIEENESHLVNLNSAIVERYDEAELRFVIGHELGHIISKNIEIQEIIRFVFPEGNGIPLLLANKIGLWDKLSELTADRYGFIASGNLEKCVSAFFKLSSGLDLSRFNLDFETFLKENDKRLEAFKKERSINVATHPINPIRIKALQYFSESGLYQSITDKKTLKQDKVLMDQMAELTDLMMVIRNSEMDKQRTLFVASAGLVMAGIDGKLTEDEYEAIVNTLSNYLIFPGELLDDIMKNKTQEKLFMETAAAILQNNPSEREAMLDFLIGITLADNKIFKSEIDFLFEVGQKMFGYSAKEIAQRIGFAIRGNFMPKLYL